MEEEEDRTMERIRESSVESDRELCVSHTLNLFSPPIQTDSSPREILLYYILYTADDKK